MLVDNLLSHCPCANKQLRIYVPAMKLPLALLFLVLCCPHLSRPAVVGTCSKNRTSNRCTGANAFWQYDGICVDGDTSTCHVPESWRLSFKLVAAIDQRLNASGFVPIKNLWIRGAGPGLSWEISTKMTKIRQGHWILDINYIYDSNALLCLQESRCSLNQKALEFRVYRDEHAVDGMFGPNLYVPLPVSGSNSGGLDFSPPLVLAYPWFDGNRVFKKFVYERNPLHFARWISPNVAANIYYPPSFEHNLFKRYPVVITFGKSIKNSLVPLLESMYVHESSIEEAFIFVMSAEHPAPFCEFNPFTVLEADPSVSGENYVYRCHAHSDECRECMTCFHPDRAELCDAGEFSEQAERCGMNRVHCKCLADAFLDNIENILIPKMSVQTLGRIMVDFPKDRISIIGIDGTGLMACYAALSRPLVYKNAACMSAPFHWPLRSLTTKESRKKQGVGLFLDEVAERMELRKEFQVLHTTQRYYIDVGEYDNDYLPIVDEHNYSDWIVDQLKSRFKIDEANILYYKNVRWGGNSVHTLRRDGDIRLLNRIKLPLLFFLKPEGGLSADHPRTPVILKQDYTHRNKKVVPVAVHSKPTVVAAAKKPKRNCEDLLETNSKIVSVPVFLLSIGKLAHFLESRI